MRRVWKFPITPDVSQEFDVGAKARIVHVAVQSGKPFVWVEHEPTGTSKLRVALVGTGASVPDGARHAGTFMVEGDAFVFHVYEFEG